MRFRKPLKITSRTSSITNAFVQAIIPWKDPSPEQRREALEKLGMTSERIYCCYCGDKATDWDHLHPLVNGKKPTGYVSDYKNLVPSCAPCNQSKSGSNWRSWMQGLAKGSPATRGVIDIEERIGRLESFAEWANIAPLDFSMIVDAKSWSDYWKEMEEIEIRMYEAQKSATKIATAILLELEKLKSK